MIHSAKDLLQEIDQTIDQLIENAKVLKEIGSSCSYEEETQALEKTQESLIAHLIHMDEILKKKDTPFKQEPLSCSKVHDKLGRSGYLNQILEKKEDFEEKLYAEKKEGHKPKIHKRKVLVKKLVNS